MRKYQQIKEIEFTPEMLRQLQLIQLEMLIEVDRICTKHNINYSIDGGTLLGAVRHKGFIPWDDDIDVIMTRSEYEIFFERCRTELDHTRFFLQERRTDPHYRVAYTRVRRKNTVYVRAGQEHMKHHSGVLIDIFILDNVPNQMVFRYFHYGLCFFFRKILWSATGKIVMPNLAHRIIYSVLSCIPKGWAFKGFKMLADICNRRSTDLVSHYAMTYPNPRINKFGMPAYLLDGYTRLEFEGHTFKAIERYHDYLTWLYGDYMQLPPTEQQKPHIHLSRFEPINE